MYSYMYVPFDLYRSHNLLADEIAVAIHSLASVNIGWFFGHFLPTFLATCEGVDDMQRATLLGNFDKSTVCIVSLAIYQYNTIHKRSIQWNHVTNL